MGRQNYLVTTFSEIALEQFQMLKENYQKLEMLHKMCSEAVELKHEICSNYVITITFAAMSLEAFLNDYAAQNLGDDYFYENFDNLRPFAKLQLISKMDCFDKLLPFSWQKEWRIAYIHDQKRLKRLASEDPVLTYEEAYTLKIKGISDIAKIVSAEDIFDMPQNIYSGYKIVDRVEPMIWPDELKHIGMPAPYQWSATSYCGWGDRPSFQNKVIEIDGGKQRLGFSI